MTTTYMAKATDVKQDWYVIDAAGKTLGRLATEAASLMRGKHKPTFTPHVDTGDFVIVINAEKVVLTGKKLDKKMYYRHSGYPGGLKTTSAREMINTKPERVIEFAVHGMLPKSKLGNQMKTKLKVYAGAEHPHQAQQPQVWELRG
jgi:large subunit ribosomal protein L13